MISSFRYYGVLLLILFLAAVLRFAFLDNRPMHGDEAVHAVKFGALLEKGDYKFDPNEYHGPTLNYFTLLPAWLTGAQNYREINEVVLRLVPAVFGLLLVLLPVFLRTALSKSVILLSMLFCAISPVMVFYSRYYIQEMLLAFFAMTMLVFAIRYAFSMNVKDGIVSGLAAGLMIATKETWIFAGFAIGVAAGIMFFFANQHIRQEIGHRIAKIKLTDVLLVGGAAILATILFYSSFLTNPAGILDAFKPYLIWAGRSGSDSIHAHPPYQYLQWLAFFRQPGQHFYSEGLMIVFAVNGIVAAFSKGTMPLKQQRVIQFLALYTVVLATGFAIIPYKTPWNVVLVMPGLAILAAVGVIFSFRFTDGKRWQAALLLMLVAGFSHFLLQSVRASFQEFASPRNPWVYAHPLPEIRNISNWVEEISAAHPEKKSIYIQVMFPDDDYWPLPWYLRDFNRVGYWNHVDYEVRSAPLIIADHELEAALAHKLYEVAPPGQRQLYFPVFDPEAQMRPNLTAQIYVSKELWNSWQQLRNEPEDQP